MTAALIAILTGFSLDLTGRILVMIFGILLPIGFFALGRKLFGEEAGIFAAFFSVLAGELLIYTVRPLPQSLGMVLLPVAFLTIFSESRKAAIVLSVAIALSHQEAVAFLAASLGAYAIALFVFGERKKIKLPLLCILAAIIAYFTWHFALMGNLNFWELAQFKNHEGNVVSLDSYMQKTGNVIAMLSALGTIMTGYALLRELLEKILPGKGRERLKNGIPSFLVFLATASVSYLLLSGNEGIKIGQYYEIAGAIILGILAVALAKVFAVQRKETILPQLFVFSLFLAGIAATKNDLIGLRVFMDRFMVYLQEPLILLAAFSAGIIAKKILETASEKSGNLKKKIFSGRKFPF